MENNDHVTTFTGISTIQRSLTIDTSSSSSRWILNGDDIYYYTAGGVAIGTTAVPDSPGFNYKLAVGGDILAERIVIKLQDSWVWPDYVFSNNYQLQDLNELEKQVMGNKHLPGIPSAKELKEKGLSLGEMQSLLLKKIEELTLYIINQQKEITDLKEAIHASE